MTQNEDRGWIVKGAEVATYSDSDRQATVTTVAKLTPTQIVLADSRRFRRKDLREVAGNTWRPVRLVPVNDARVRRALAAQTVSRLSHKLDKLLRVRAVDATPHDLLASLDQAAKMITAARRRITDLTQEE